MYLFFQQILYMCNYYFSQKVDLAFNLSYTLLCSKYWRQPICHQLPTDYMAISNRATFLQRPTFLFALSLLFLHPCKQFFTTKQLAFLQTVWSFNKSKINGNWRRAHKHNVHLASPSVIMFRVYFGHLSVISVHKNVVSNCAIVERFVDLPYITTK